MYTVASEWQSGTPHIHEYLFKHHCPATANSKLEIAKCITKICSYTIYTNSVINGGSMLLPQYFNPVLPKTEVEEENRP